METGNPRYDSRGALRRPLVSVNKPDADASGRGDDGGTNSGATTLRGQTTNENTRLVVDAIHAVGSTSDDGDVTFSVDESADDDTGFFADETFDEGDEKQATDDDDTSQETTEARTAAGYKLGSHLDNMQGGKKTELVVNAANAAEVGIRVGVVEDGALVETWYEARAGPGEGMRVGDVYLGVVAKVIGGMQGVLVDVTGKGPPFALMQKGVDEPALAWRKADELYEREVAAEIETLREMETAGNTSRDTSGDTAGNTSGDSSDGETTGDTLETGDDDSDSASAVRRIERLERKARNSSFTETKLGGRWADAWAEGVGVSDSFDVGTLQGIDGGSRGRHASVSMRLDGVKVDDGDDDEWQDKAIQVRRFLRPAVVPTPTPTPTRSTPSTANTRHRETVALLPETVPLQTHHTTTRCLKKQRTTGGRRGDAAAASRRLIWATRVMTRRMTRPHTTSTTKPKRNATRTLASGLNGNHALNRPRAASRMTGSPACPSWCKVRPCAFPKSVNSLFYL